MESLVDPHGDNDSNRFRVITFRTGIRMIEMHPWFGLGPDDVHRQFNSYVPADIRRPLPAGFYGHLHNVYIEFAAERGLPALLFLLWFIGLVGRDCIQGIWRARRVKSGPLFILHATIGILIGVLIGGLFEHNLGDSEVVMMFVCIIGVAYAALANLPPGLAALAPSRA
jgi:O-antigen ligase